jgi:cation transport regulator ChaB
MPAKVDRMVKHIKDGYKKKGKSDKKAEDIAWATVNKQGKLDNKNKKKKSSK